MCPGNGTIQYAMGIGLANVHLGMEPANVPWEWDYQMCPGKELANVPREWDYPMCHVNGTSKCALGIGLSNVHWEWN